MNLKVTSKARGEVIFPTISYPLKAGHKIHVSPEQFYNSDIQAGLRQGFLELDEESESHLETMTEIVNISSRALGLGEISLLIGERRYISYEVSRSPAVSIAVSQGLVQLIHPGEEEPVIKKAKKQTKKKKRQNIGGRKKAKAEVDAEEEADANEEAPHKMRAWDPETKSMLEKEEASKRVVQHEPLPKSIEEAQEDGIQVGEIDFTEEEKAPNKDSKKKVKKRRVSKKKVAKSSSSGKKIKLSASSKEGSSKKKSKSSIKPVGRVRQQPTAGLPHEEELSFVDQEQTVERMRQRGLAPQNDEID